MRVKRNNDTEDRKTFGALGTQGKIDARLIETK